jgi:putative SOS response-associated peptidase YedK
MKLALQAPSVTALKIRFSIRNEIKPPKNELLPGSWLPIMRDSASRKAEMFRWGISEAKMGANDRLVFATKIENLVTSKGRHLLERRLIVPVESFEVRSDGQTHRICNSDRQPMALAGVWDVDGHWRGRPVRAFRLITGPTVDGLEHLGARMPLVLCPENESTWLWHFTEEEHALDALEPYLKLEAA